MEAGENCSYLTLRKKIKKQIFTTENLQSFANETWKLTSNFKIL